jgi:hypothetical protein
MKITITDNPDKTSNDALLVNNISFDEFWQQHICPNTEYEELEFFDEPKAIRAAESIYIETPFMVEDVIKVICSFEKGEDDYDIISNAGYGQTSSMTRRSIVGKKGIYKVSPDCIEGINIKPLLDFKKDYTNFNRKNYESLMKAVDDFYDNLRNNTRR